MNTNLNQSERDLDGYNEVRAGCLGPGSYDVGCRRYQCSLKLNDELHVPSWDQVQSIEILARLLFQAIRCHRTCNWQ